MICPYASELGDDEGIPSGVFVAARYRSAYPEGHPPPPLSERGQLGVRRFSGSSVSLAELYDLRRKLYVAFPEGQFRKGKDFARKRKAVAA